MLDTGASKSHFTEHSELEDARPCRRVVRAANGGSLVGVRVGHAAPPPDCVNVLGLQANLVSVGEFVAATDTMCVFGAVAGWGVGAQEGEQSLFSRMRRHGRVSRRRLGDRYRRTGRVDFPRAARLHPPRRTTRVRELCA